MKGEVFSGWMIIYCLMMDDAIGNADAIALTLIRAALAGLASPFTLHSIASHPVSSLSNADEYLSAIHLPSSTNELLTSAIDSFPFTKDVIV